MIGCKSEKFALLIYRKNEERNMQEFDSVTGYENVKLELAQIADVLKNPQPYQEFRIGHVNDFSPKKEIIL